jgi:hypothetical protein
VGRPGPEALTVNGIDLARLETDIERWVDGSSSRFQSQFPEDDRVWVLKYFSPLFLDGFLKKKQLVISTSPGFTWGDGIYVTPLRYPFSTMMYGRIGVLGWIDAGSLRAYDAIDRRGIELYQRWIAFSTYVYRLLTTTIHADRANRILRNAFRRRFRVDVTYFRPDQFNRNYVRLSQDQWFVVSDWSGVRSNGPGQQPAFSARVRDCEWVAVVGEHFQESKQKTHFLDLIGPHLHRSGKRKLSDQQLAAWLRKCYGQTASGAGTNIAHILE